MVVHGEETAVIKIRTISARKIGGQPVSDAIIPRASESVKSGGFPDPIPPSLADISEKLKELPFNGFKLQAQEEVQVRLKEIKEMQLASHDSQLPSHSLKLKLLGMNRGKVCLWINWSESAGEEILDSRVHFKQGEQFITGTEAKDGLGMLVVLQVTKQD